MRFSIVIPTIDSAPQIPRQTINDHEIIVINDNERIGPAWARNQGIDKAKGEYVIFLDSDCYPVSDKWLEEIWAGLEGGKVDVAHARVLTPIDSNLEMAINKVCGTPDYGDKDFVVEDMLTFPGTNLIVKKEVFNQIRFWEDLFFCEDVAFSYDAYTQGFYRKYIAKGEVRHLHRVKLTDNLIHTFIAAKNTHAFLKRYRHPNPLRKEIRKRAILFWGTPILLPYLLSKGWYFTLHFIFQSCGYFIAVLKGLR